MSWWLEKPYRQVQNNLRDIDGEMDVDYEVAMLKDLGANVVQVGCGGISAFGPSKLDCQRPTPYLQGDKFGEIITKCHENGIRVIARFDPSKVHQDYLTTNPEWFSRTLTGEPVRFADCANVCVNGPYQQERMVDVLTEALQNYPLDGIFFNMPGYVNFDYDRNYVGICQCDSCKKRFHSWSGGMTLPTEENHNDPVFRKYEEFKEETVAELLRKIRKTVKDINPEVGLSTYNDKGIDIVRSEAQSNIGAPKHFWIYAASDDSVNIPNTFANKVTSDVAINAVDIPIRFQGVSPYMNEMRLAQCMAAGSNLDWCIIGAFKDYPDRLNYDGVKRVFHMQAKHRNLFASLKSAAKVLLVQPKPFFARSTFGNEEEYRGLFYMLKEQHIPFDPVVYTGLDNVTDRFDDYDVIILPDLSRRPSEKVREALLKTSASIVATGHTFEEDPELLEKLFGVKIAGKLENVKAAYLQTEPKKIFTSFPLRDWVFLLEDSYRLELTTAKGCLPLIGPARYAPPERAYGHKLTGDSMAALNGKNLYFSWQPGKLYYALGYEDHKQIFLDLLNKVCPLELPFITDAPNCVEIQYHTVDEHTCTIQFINISGYNGRTMTKPIPMNHIHVTMNAITPLKVEELTQDGLVSLPVEGKTLTLSCQGIYAGYKITF